jgi:hypothetical protein
VGLAVSIIISLWVLFTFNIEIYTHLFGLWSWFRILPAWSCWAKQFFAFINKRLYKKQWSTNFLKCFKFIAFLCSLSHYLCKELVGFSIIQWSQHSGLGAAGQQYDNAHAQYNKLSIIVPSFELEIVLSCELMHASYLQIGEIAEGCIGQLH